MFLKVPHRVCGLVGVVMVAVLWLTMPQASSAQPKQPQPKVYSDEDYDFKVSSPQGWRRFNPASLSVPGEVCRAWTPDGTSTISIFVQKPGRAVHPRDLLEQSVNRCKPLGCTFEAQEVKAFGGMQAMWLIATGPGTGAALTGKGDVPTSQHWVAIPREEDVLVLLLNAPASDFRSAEAVFNAMLGTLAVGGVQTPEQRSPEPRRAPATAVNLDFEGGPAAGGLPSHWGGRSRVASTGVEGYELAVDTQVAHGGKISGRIRSLLASPPDDAFGTLTQSVSAEAWRGKRARLSGWLRTRDVKLGVAGLWMRVDGPGTMLAFDNMSRRGVKGTTDWQRYEVVLDVPAEAREIFFGALLHHDGSLWVDDLSLEEVPNSVASTEPGLPAEKAANLDFEVVSKEGQAPAGWDRDDLYPPTGGDGYEVTLDRESAHSGRTAGRIRRLTQAKASFGPLTQAVSPEGFRGGKARLSGWLKTKDVKSGFAGLWLRIDGRGTTLGFDNMHDRGPRGTTEWTRYEVELDVPREAHAIAFGALLTGDGTVWVDDLALEALPAVGGS